MIGRHRTGIRSSGTDFQKRRLGLKKTEGPCLVGVGVGDLDLRRLEAALPLDLLAPLRLVVLALQLLQVARQGRDGGAGRGVSRARVDGTLGPGSYEKEEEQEEEEEEKEGEEEEQEEGENV